MADHISAQPQVCLHTVQQLCSTGYQQRANSFLTASLNCDAAFQTPPVNLPADSS